MEGPISSELVECLLLQEAEVSGQAVPEPFDVRTEEGLEAGALLDERSGLDDSGRCSG